MSAWLVGASSRDCYTIVSTAQSRRHHDRQESLLRRGALRAFFQDETGDSVASPIVTEFHYTSMTYLAAHCCKGPRGTRHG